MCAAKQLSQVPLKNPDMHIGSSLMKLAVIGRQIEDDSEG